MKQTQRILCTIVLICLSMAFVEAVLQPGYAVKSAIKLLLFAAAVCALGDVRCWLRREGLGLGLLLGGGIFAVILLAFFLFRPFLDLDSIAQGLLGKEGVSRENFLWVALYISVVNSLLEELLFRGLGYLELRKHAPEAWQSCKF